MVRAKDQNNFPESVVTATSLSSYKRMQVVITDVSRFDVLSITKKKT